MLEHSFSRLFVPWNIRSHDGTFLLGTIRSLELSFSGPFVPGNFRSRERINPANLSLRGPIVPWTVRSLEPSFQVPWTFPAADHSFICQQSSKEQRNKQKRRPLTATVHSRYTQVDRRYSASRLNRFSSSQRGLLNNSFGALHCQKTSIVSACVICKSNVTGRQHVLECDTCIFVFKTITLRTQLTLY